MLRRIGAEQAGLGMYVRAFEGSWLHHPFWRARFLLRTDRQLARIRRSGVPLLIDTTRGADLPPPPVTSNAVLPRQRPAPAPAPTSPRTLSPRQPAKAVAPPTFGKADKTRAAALAKRSTEVVRALFGGGASGAAPAAAAIAAVVDDIAATLEQNSAAFLTLTRLRTQDEALYTHAVAVCALMIDLAREVGCSATAVRSHGMAGLLHDIGKTAPGIDPADLRLGHPQLGHQMLAAEPDLPPLVRDVCLHHHERVDGTGFPFGLHDEAVSRAARMAAICDLYENASAGSPDRPGRPPAEVLEAMEALGGQLDQALLFRFMQSIGVFPPGKLVRLRTNRLALVLPAAGADLRPIARAFHDTATDTALPYADVVLSDRLCDDQAIAAEPPMRWAAADWPALRDAILHKRSLPAAAIRRA